MLANKLRHRIAIDRPASTRDPLNGAVSESWVAVAEDLPAAVVPLSGREILAADTEMAGTRVRFLVRYDPALSITPAMRIRHEGYAYNITEVIADPSLRRHLTLLAERGIREGT